MNNKMIRFTIVLVMCCFPLSKSEAQSVKEATNMASVHQLEAERTNPENDILFETIELDLEDEHISQALQGIADAANLKLMYSEDLYLKEKRVTVQNTSVSLYDALWKVLDGTGLRFTISPTRQLVIVKGEAETESNHELAEQQAVSGKVVDFTTGESLPGVNIIVLGSEEETGNIIGTQTDSEGNYSINVPGLHNTLVFTYIGYQRLEIDIDGRSEILVELHTDITMLDEAVVVGFGTQERVNLSGAVDQIDAAQLQSRSISSVSQGLQGMIPNLNIDYMEGSPGADPTINIRGFTSINGGTPLILIDGVPSETRELTRLDPQDVASISVLKDASSAAIYGARAAFGVLLVETKRGTREGMNISFSSRSSWDTPTVLPDKTTDPYIYMRWQDNSTSSTPWNYINYTDDEFEWARQRSDNPDNTPAVREDPNNPGTWQYMGNRDWISYFLGDYGMSTNNVLSIDGGSEKTSFYLSGSYDLQSGALKLADDHFDRWGVRSRVQYRPYTWLTVSNNTNFTRSARTMPTRWSWGGNAMQSFYLIEPMSWDKNPDGTWANSRVGNLAAQLTEGGDLSDARNTLQTTFQTVSTLIEEILTLNLDYTYRTELRNYNYDYKNYNIGYGPDDVRQEGNTSVYRNRTTYDYHVFNLYSSLALDLGGHRVSSIFGFNQEVNDQYQVVSEVGDVISSELPSLSLSLGDPTVSDYYSGWAIRGIFGRLNYTYQDRYILEFNGRYDGSTRFSKDDRYGFFPSASIAWRIEQEGFMQSYDWLDMFKLRASYGSLGNQSVSNFGYIPTMSTYTPNYILGDTRPLGISSPDLVSANYSWETVSTQNFGVDIDLFESRLSAVFDVYTRKTENMLTLGRELPSVLGASEPRENAADLETKGWELTLSYRNITNVMGSTLNYGIRFTLADSRAWITRFDNPEKFLNQYYEGYEIGEIWGFDYEGLFKNEEEINNHADQSPVIPWGVLDVVPGWPKFADLNNDGTIRAGTTVEEPEDLKIIGNSQARYRFGVNIDLGWKNFDFQAFFQGVGKRDFYPFHYLYWGFYQQPYEGGWLHLFDYYRAEDDSPELMGIHSQSYIDAGLAHQNTDAEFPVLQAWLTDNNTPGIGQTPNNGFMLDASYIRLKNLTIGYSIPIEITQRLGISRARIYISGENLAEWSEVKDFFDPEAITDDGYGYRYPFQRRYSIGITLNF